MTKKKCPRVAEEYLIQDQLTTNSCAEETKRTEGLERVVGDTNTIGRGEWSDIMINNYFPDEGKYGGAGCMI